MDRYNYRRRETSPVRVGGITIGGSSEIRLQSMANTSTMDTAASVAQAKRLADAGSELVRFTTQGEREAANMGEISAALRSDGYDVPLVADVHFNPKAALKAAETCEKVRINPGNFVDAARTFRQLEYTDQQYAAELGRIRAALLPLIEACRANGTALRLGVNHGSLSDRIMSRYGDTPAGMTESAMEFLRILKAEGFDDVVISIKASNTVIMTETVRLLAEAMRREGMAYPLHLGVTEAGDGEDGRIKSAVGIGTLLAEGLGDTIRVSLSEEPENEIPVARLLRDHITARKGHKPVAEPFEVKPGNARDYADFIEYFGSVPRPAVVGLDVRRQADWHEADAGEIPFGYRDRKPVVLTSRHANPVGEIRSWIDRFVAAGGKNPIMIRLSYPDADKETVQVKAGADFGALLLTGYGSGIEIDAPQLSSEERDSMALGILQAARLRFSKPEYIACPGCGRTLFDLQDTLARVKAATAHLKGLKIGVMGCIVNGPGEMADADYGYVGAGPGRVSLYKGKELISKNIPAEEAVSRLVELIKQHGDWHDPGQQSDPDLEF